MHAAGCLKHKVHMSFLEEKTSSRKKKLVSSDKAMASGPSWQHANAADYAIIPALMCRRLRRGQEKKR